MSTVETVWVVPSEIVANRAVRLARDYCGSGPTLSANDYGRRTTFLALSAEKSAGLSQSLFAVETLQPDRFFREIRAQQRPQSLPSRRRFT
jgi:hypothetical protein